MRGDVWFPQPAPVDHPWRSMPHHGMTPHISGTSLTAQTRYAAGVREILECWFDNRPIRDEYLIVSAGKLRVARGRIHIAQATQPADRKKPSASRKADLARFPMRWSWPWTRSWTTETLLWCRTLELKQLLHSSAIICRGLFGPSLAKPRSLEAKATSIQSTGDATERVGSCVGVWVGARSIARDASERWRRT